MHLPNVNSRDDSSLILATAGSTCLEEVETCTTGMTLAFWVKVSQNQFTKYTNVMESTSVSLFINFSPTHFGVRFFLQRNSTHRIKYQSTKELKFDKWHLVVLSYDVQSGPEFYLNGCADNMTVLPPASHSRVASNLIVGCGKDNKNCINGNFDDLRLWTDKKDKYFAWMLWSI